MLSFLRHFYNPNIFVSKTNNFDFSYFPVVAFNSRKIQLYEKVYVKLT